MRIIIKIYRLGIEIIGIVEPERWMDGKISGVKGKSSGRTDNLYLELECIVLIIAPTSN